MNKTKIGGICGPSVVAKLFNKDIEEVIANWDGGFKEYTPMNEVKNEVRKYGWESVKLVGGKKSKVLELPIGYYVAIARIQWEGDWGHWVEAQKHTHYILLEHSNVMKRTLVFCVNEGWFSPKSIVGKNYLKNGYITSYLVEKL